jgi:hypothetical protein
MKLDFRLMGLGDLDLSWFGQLGRTLADWTKDDYGDARARQLR